MKRIIIIFIALFATYGANAQFQVGVRGGGNFAKTTSDMPNYDNNMVFLPGINAGVVVEKGLLPAITPLISLNLRIEADYSQKGTKIKYKDNLVFGDASSINQITYLELPVSLKLKIGPVYAFTGPHIAYAVSGVSKVKDLPRDLPDTEEKIDWDKTDKRFDYGIQGGAGFTFLNIVPMVQPFVEVRYILGLADLNGSESTPLTPNAINVKNNAITVSVGILLGKK